MIQKQDETNFESFMREADLRPYEFYTGEREFIDPVLNKGGIDFTIFEKEDYRFVGTLIGPVNSIDVLDHETKQSKRVNVGVKYFAKTMDKEGSLILPELMSHRKFDLKVFWGDNEIWKMKMFGFVDLNYTSKNDKGVRETCKLSPSNIANALDNLYNTYEIYDENLLSSFYPIRHINAEMSSEDFIYSHLVATTNIGFSGVESFEMFSETTSLFAEKSRKSLFMLNYVGGIPPHSRDLL